MSVFQKRLQFIKVIHLIHVSEKTGEKVTKMISYDSLILKYFI